MVFSPERESEKYIESSQEEIEVPANLARLGIHAVEKEFKTPVTDDSGRPLLQNVPAVNITLPTDSTTLSAWAKGPVSAAITWLAVYWLRMIKKAMHLGR